MMAHFSRPEVAGQISPGTKNRHDLSRLRTRNRRKQASNVAAPSSPPFRRTKPPGNPACSHRGIRHSRPRRRAHQPHCAEGGDKSPDDLRAFRQQVGPLCGNIGKRLGGATYRRTYSRRRTSGSAGGPASAIRFYERSLRTQWPSCQSSADREFDEGALYEEVIPYSRDVVSSTLDDGTAALARRRGRKIGRRYRSATTLRHDCRAQSVSPSERSHTFEHVRA